MDSKKLELTVEEGNALLEIACLFGLPEKLGDQTYTVGDRSMAADEVMAFRREIRAWSPLLQSEKRYKRFGPAEAWTEVKSDAGQIGHKLIKPLMTVGIRVDEEILGGLLWCALVALHPSSNVCQIIERQQDLFWPVVKKAGKTRTMREQIGLTEKVQPKRWKDDAEYEKKAAEEAVSKQA